jgi:hypothetical protein
MVTMKGLMTSDDPVGDDKLAIDDENICIDAQRHTSAEVV